MIALALIWIVAALIGLAAAALWEPALALIVSVADVVDPSLAAFVRDVAAVGAGADAAIGWIVALAIGVPLTLVWFAARVVMGALRGPRPDRPRPIGTQPSRRPAGEPHDVGHARPAPVDRAAPEPITAPLQQEREPSSTRDTHEGPPPRVTSEAPRWGRQ